MASGLFIEANEVDVVGQKTGALHLYLVWRGPTGDEYVIRSGSSRPWFPVGSELEVDVNVPIAESADARGDETPADRFSTPVALDGLSADAAWGLMVKYAAAIDAAGIDYELFGENSNATVGALLHAVGVDPRAALPDAIDPDAAVGLGAWDDIVERVAPPEDGTVEGTDGDDLLAGIQIDDVIVAFAGDDEVRAGDGNDDVDGGDGDDRLWGEAGFDLLRGGDGDDVLRAGAPGLPDPDAGAPRMERLYGEAGRDKLVGGDGPDRLDGGSGGDRLYGLAGDDALWGGSGGDLLVGGAGANDHWGGAGADTFRFAAADAMDDVIHDFAPAADRIEIRGVEDPAALAVAAAGDAGQHTLLTFADARVLVENLDPALIDTIDLRLADVLVA